MLSAKLLVPLGAPLQLRDGDRLPPVQPNPLNTCSLAMVAPSLISGLVTVMLCALAALAPSALRPSAAIHIGSLVMVISSPSMSRAFCVRPADGSHSNFRVDGEARQAKCQGLPGLAQSFM